LVVKISSLEVIEQVISKMAKVLLDVTDNLSTFRRFATYQILFQRAEILCAAENTQQVVQAPGAVSGRGKQHCFPYQHVPVLSLLALVAGIDRNVFGLYTCQGDVIQVQEYHHQQRKPLSAACGVNPHSIGEAMVYF
jgi:hypothetical protein